MPAPALKGPLPNEEPTKLKTLFAAAMAAAALYAGSANAMTYSYRMAGRQIVVNATGEIMPNEIDLFTRWGLSLPPGFSILRSRGLFSICPAATFWPPKVSRS